ncbi:MAG: iron chelate uptake ABC transporter family permease subunit [Chloroflexota bacterium]|nr:iron chelate uptake ABC transporter family permease subunit [Chloroflexota bacterium]
MRADVAPRPIVRGPAIGRATLVVGGGGALLLGALVAGIGLGSVAISPDDTLAVLGQRLLGIGAGAGVSDSVETIVMELRLPRVLGAMVVGAGLASAGTVFQAVLRNPMADPYIIGTAAGASLGATVGIVLPLLLPVLALGAGTAWLGLGVVQLLAFVGGIGTVLLVIAVARSGGRLPSVTLLLTGYAVSSLLAAGVALLMFLSGRALAAIFSWLMGSLAAVGWIDLVVAAPVVLAVFVALLVRWRSLNLLLLGDGPAAHLGLDVGREKLRLTMLATLGTSAVVAISGTIGFVGLVVPHLLRLAIGPDHRLLLPASAIFGAVLLVLADLGARLAGGIPVGVVTAFVGAPFFLWLLRRSRRVSGPITT